MARLKEGFTLETASAEMSSIAQQLAKQYPDSDDGRGATVVPLTEMIVGNPAPDSVAAVERSHIASADRLRERLRTDAGPLREPPA
jgi:hypothetical protein